MLRSEGDRLTKVVVCTPEHEYFRIGSLEAHNINQVADRDQTRAQHDKLKSIMARSGCEVIDVDELSGHPNSVFTRDVALCTAKGYIELRMGLESRRGEESWMSRILDSLGEPRAGTIRAPGTAEGGDVVLAGDVALVGRSSRTNEPGAKQLSEILTDMGYEVRIVPVPEAYLHLGGAMSAVAPGRIVCCREEFADDLLQDLDVVDVPKRGPSTGNVICLADNEVIGNVVENLDTLAVLERRGVRVHGIDLSEFRKGAGGPSCLILPVERKGRDEFLKSRVPTSPSA